MKRKVIAFSIAEDMIKALDLASRASNMSRSRYIENLLIEALDIEHREDDNNE